MACKDEAGGDSPHGRAANISPTTAKKVINLVADSTGSPLATCINAADFRISADTFSGSGEEQPSHNMSGRHDLTVSHNDSPKISSRAAGHQTDL